MTIEKALERWDFAGFEEGGRVHKIRNVGGFQKPVKARKRWSPRASERCAVLRTP